MSPQTVLALMGFAFVMSISPGPANFLLLASGANFGFRRSIPLALGISIGFLTMVFFVGIGLGQILANAPVIYTVLKIVCATYVFWLAVKIARSRTIGQAANDGMEKPISFPQAALFQLVNPKAWAVALVLSVSYTSSEDYLVSLLVMMGVFAIVNLPSIGVWALSGAALRDLLERSGRIVLFNRVMALLLVGSMMPVLFGAIE